MNNKITPGKQNRFNILISMIILLPRVIFYEDFKRLSAAFGYVSTSDMHDDNFGIKIVDNPSPSDIVILDFDASITN